MIKKTLAILAVLAIMNKPAFSQLYNSKTAYDSAAKAVDSQVGVDAKNINSFKIPYWKTTHIVSPEPILYVDISSPYVEGDLPEKNIFRLRPNATPSEGGHGIGIDENFTVTIVTETFITVYNFSFNQTENRKDNLQATASILTIDPSKAIQLNNYSKLTKTDYDRLAIRAMSTKRHVFNVHSKESGMEFWMNNVYVIGDLMLFDMGAKNHTNLQYDMTGINFRLADKYAVAATVSQEIELKPLYSFTDDAVTSIESKWRNFYILRKFTYPAQKVLKIQMSEKQISGRPVTISVDYNQILASKNLLN